MHEVRVPLNSVSTGIGVMSSYDLSEEARDTLTLMKSATDVIADTLNNILSMQKIENGEFELNLSPFNVYETLQAVSMSLREGWSSKNILLDITVDENIPSVVSGDSSRLEHVLSSLLNSAASLALPSSKIKLSVNRITRYDSVDVELTFEIAYKGAGLTEAETTAICQPYMQLSPHDTPREGVIGLHVCKKIIALHGGRLRAYSGVDGGNIFEFNISFSNPTETGRSNKFDKNQIRALFSATKSVSADIPQDNCLIDVLPHFDKGASAQNDHRHVKDFLRQQPTMAIFSHSGRRIGSLEVDKFPTESYCKKKALIVDGK